MKSIDLFRLNKNSQKHASSFLKTSRSRTNTKGHFLKNTLAKPYDTKNLPFLTAGKSRVEFYKFLVCHMALPSNSLKKWPLILYHYAKQSLIKNAALCACKAKAIGVYESPMAW